LVHGVSRLSELFPNAISVRKRSGLQDDPSCAAPCGARDTSRALPRSLSAVTRQSRSRSDFRE